MRRTWSGLVLVAIFAGVAPAAASPISLLFTGTIDEANDENGVTDGSIAVGAEFSGSVSFDDAATDLDSDTGHGQYLFDSAPWTLTVQVGNYSLVASGFLIAVDDAFDFLGFTALAEDTSLIGPLSAPLEDASFQYAFNGVAPLGSDELASVLFALLSWSDAPFHLQIGTGELGDFEAYGSVDSLVAVPEPGSSALLLVGALLLELRRRLR